MDDNKKILILLTIIIGFLLYSSKVQEFTQENESDWMGTMQNMFNPTEVTAGAVSYTHLTLPTILRV